MPQALWDTSSFLTFPAPRDLWDTEVIAKTGFNLYASLDYGLGATYVDIWENSPFWRQRAQPWSPLAALQPITVAEQDPLAETESAVN